MHAGHRLAWYTVFAMRAQQSQPKLYDFGAWELVQARLVRCTIAQLRLDMNVGRHCVNLAGMLTP